MLQKKTQKAKKLKYLDTPYKVLIFTQPTRQIYYSYLTPNTSLSISSGLIIKGFLNNIRNIKHSIKALPFILYFFQIIAREWQKNINIFRIRHLNAVTFFFFKKLLRIWKSQIMYICLKNSYTKNKKYPKSLKRSVRRILLS